MYGFIAWGFVFDVVHVHAIVDYGVLLGLSRDCSLEGEGFYGCASGTKRVISVILRVFRKKGSLCPCYDKC